MPTIFTHAIAGATIARIAGAGSQRKVLSYAAAFVAVLPDADVIGLYTGLDTGVSFGGMLGHRGLTHSLAFACATGLVGTVWSGAGWNRAGWGRVRVAGCLAAATASHGFLDALTDGGRGVAFFAPFSSERFFFPVTPIAVSPIGAAFFSARGVSVLTDEMIWVGIPLLILNIAVAMVRARRG
jgi:inner membrane protein